MMNYGNSSNAGYGHNQGGINGYPSYNNSGMGGFSNDTSINNYGSAIDSEAPIKKPKNMSLRHVTIRQINSLAVPEDKDAPFIMDGEEVSQVVLVAALSSPPESQAASLTLSVEDGTGFLDVRFWTSTAGGEATPLSQQIESINPRTYIQIIGGLKAFGNKISINGIHVRAITDPNEIHMHYLECIHTYLMLAGTKKNMGSGLNNFQGFQKPNAIPSGYNHVSEAKSPDDLRRSILHYVWQNGQGHQMYISNIQQTFVGQGIPPASVDNTIEWLIEEGHAFKNDNIIKANSGTI